MKVGILADIHANLAALRVTLDAAEREGVEQLFVLGDIVGYYYWPAECLELLNRWPVKYVVGNHEMMLADARDDEAARNAIRRKYGSGIDVALANLGEADTDRLAGFPRTIAAAVDGHRARLCHGSPWDTDVYLYPDASPEARVSMAAGGEEFVFYGHTHYPVCWRVGDTVVANPGSVGQPRNRAPGAHWLLWDVGSGELAPRIQDYDPEPVIRECRMRDPEMQYLASVLTRT